MNFHKRMHAFLLLLIVSFVWISSSQAFFTNDLSDLEISGAIESDLFIDEGVSSHLIDVSTRDGIVTLSGSVDNLLAKERAIKIAQTIRGVRSVIDKIVVLPVERTNDEIMQNIQKSITWDPATDAREIDVEVEQGVVTLKGEVDSWQEKQLATEVAKGVAGVRKINNEIIFNYKSERPDEEIRADIVRRIKSDVWIVDLLIQVHVDKGNVSLTGAVGSVAEKQRAGQLAWVAGVKKVDNSNLSVNSGINDGSKMTGPAVFRTDDEIKNAIKETFLYDLRVNPFNPKVEVDRGHVTLSGVVDNLKAKKAAEKDAQNTAGVWGVKNNLKVRPKGPPSDSEIVQYVRDALAFHPLVDRYDINVIVRNKKVILSGIVDTAFDKKRAENVASSIAGVVAVDNRLSINNSWPFKDDHEIKENIEKEYFWSIYVDGDDIIVAVDNGKAYLRGHVDNWKELQAAVRNAFEGGARSVETHLKIPDGPNELLVRNHYSYDNLDIWP